VEALLEAVLAEVVAVVANVAWFVCPRRVRSLAVRVAGVSETGRSEL
jgi:hypothetical protein